MVSIIIPCYNPRWISDCVTSCQEQSHKDIEIIVVNDIGSPGSSASTMISRLGVIAIENKENMGVSFSRNAGIKASKGDYILPLDADDMLAPESISCRLKEFEKDPDLQVVYGPMLKIHGDISYGEALGSKCDIHPSKYTVPMYRRDVFEKFGLFHEPLRSKEDKEMSYRLGVHKKSPIKKGVKFKRVEEPVYYYRRHDDAKRKSRIVDVYFDVRTCMEFDKRIMELRKNGITKQNTEFLI